jgi:DNA-binding YbaB/EbfC family protein
MWKEIANLTSLLRQAQQLSGKVQEATEQLKARRVQGSSGGGMVEVEANGLGEVLRVQIDPQLVARGDREMIEDLVPSAVNHALVKARELHMEVMQSMAQGLEIPGIGEALSQFMGPAAQGPEKP